MSRFHKALQHADRSADEKAFDDLFLSSAGASLPVDDTIFVPDSEPLTDADETFLHGAIDVPSIAQRQDVRAIPPAVAEQYRIVRTRLLQLPNRPQCIVISSASFGDGKTLTAINLAEVLAANPDERVLLLDADMRHCGVAKALHFHAAIGLSDVLSGNVALQEAILPVDETPNLFVLPSGPPPLNPAELLGGDAWNSVVEALRREFSTIIIDSTTVAAVADFQLVAQAADGVLLVVRPDNTNRSAFKRAVEKEVGARLLGVVVNGYRDSPFWFLSTRGQERKSIKPGAGLWRWFSKRSPARG